MNSTPKFYIRCLDTNFITNVTGIQTAELQYVKVQENKNFFFPVTLRPNAGHGLLILEVSKSHTTMHHSR